MPPHPAHIPTLVSHMHRTAGLPATQPPARIHSLSSRAHSHEHIHAHRLHVRPLPSHMQAATCARSATAHTPLLSSHVFSHEHTHTDATVAHTLSHVSTPPPTLGRPTPIRIISVFDLSLVPSSI